MRDGTVPGLWIDHQWTNVLVDSALPWLLSARGVSGAERAFTTAAVLLFFWSAFSLVSAVRGQPVYWVAPWLAILSYGFVFQTGLLNYYISAGFAFCLFRMLWRKRPGWHVLSAMPLLIVAFWAHPLPPVWCLGVAAYCQIAERQHVRHQVLLFFSSIGLLFLIRVYVMGRYDYSWGWHQIRYSTGADQALLYGGWGYLTVAVAILVFSVMLIVQRENRWKSLLSVPAQAYCLTAAAAVVIPTALRASPQEAWASLLAQRLSLLSAVLLFAVLGRSLRRKWHVAAGILVAGLFFGLLYRDVGRAARLEAKMQQLVHTLPAGERVISYVVGLDPNAGADRSLFAKFTRLPGFGYFGARVSTVHLLSRACIGHCFDYMNYEPSSGQFRIHAKPGNPAVVANPADADLMEKGS